MGISSILLTSSNTFGQGCPPNIDFERGTLDGWRFYTGIVENQFGVNTFTLTESSDPVDDRHTIIPRSALSIDPYGNFPTSSPNGSEYCVKLGNDYGGGQAEAIAYEFTIPSDRNTFSLQYYYAVVFQDPNHQIYEQPRMEIEITNVTDNSIITCASFSFIPFGTALPGFFPAYTQIDNTPIWCKDWSPVSINLNGHAGKTIRLLFRTGDCTFRRHFGYAYIDVDTDCSGEFVGASFCPEDPEITVAAPSGFQNYRWMNSDRTQTIGTGQTLTLRPPPPSGTTVSVELTPYPGFGCQQTLTARLINNLNYTAEAGPDTLSCNGEGVRIGNVGRPGLVYRWFPSDNLSNPETANPLAYPKATTNYVLTVRSPGGGCTDTDTVQVVASTLLDSILVLGKKDFCLGSGDSALLRVSDAPIIQWYKNAEPIIGAKLNRLRVDSTGSYFAVMEDALGCKVTTEPVVVNISSIPDADFGINNNAQCFIGHRFVFTNASTNTIGNMQFEWHIEQNPFLQSRDIQYSFSQPGTYPVKLIVKSNETCMDSVTSQVTIYPNPTPDFQVGPVCIDIPFAPKNLTPDNIGSPITYTWTFSTGEIFNTRDPLPKIYNSPGSVNVSLSVVSDQCPEPVVTSTQSFMVEAPAAARRYPSAFAIRNVPLLLEARNIGTTALWEPANQLSDATLYNPVFTGTLDREYLITLQTDGGCVTTDTLVVMIVEKAEIYVPTGFTPNNDGLNDFLRPVLMGIGELHYFRVYNRWGQIVYEAKQDKPGWNGIIKGKPQPAQTYTWMAEGVGIDGRVIKRKGSSILIR